MVAVALVLAGLKIDDVGRMFCHMRVFRYFGAGRRRNHKTSCEMIALSLFVFSIRFLGDLQVVTCLPLTGYSDA